MPDICSFECRKIGVCDIGGVLHFKVLKCLKKTYYVIHLFLTTQITARYTSQRISNTLLHSANNIKIMYSANIIIITSSSSKSSYCHPKHPQTPLNITQKSQHNSMLPQSKSITTKPTINKFNTQITTPLPPI